MRKLIIIFLILGISPVLAQSEFSLYRLNGNLAQANMLNPAFAPNAKVVIGLPVVSSIYLSSDMDGIAFRDIFSNSENDSLKLDTLSLFSKLKPSNHIKFRESVQLFYFGLRGKRSYFSFGIHHVMETRFHYAGDLVGWAIRGPGDHHYAGKPLDFSNFYGKGVAYNKVSVNFARDINSKLRVGARFNYLMGMATGETTKIDGRLTLGIDSVNINTGTLQFQTAGFDFFDQNNLGASDYVKYFLKGNKGMAWDIGATYNVTDNLTFSAALNDLGYITWKDYTRSYTVAPVNYTFKGFDMLDYLNQSQGDEFLQAELDSLENLFTTTETTGTKFKTSLIGKFYAGFNFRVLRINNFSFLFYADMFQKRIDPAVSLGYNLQLGRTLAATVGITYQNGNITNIGAGLALKLTHLQFYATSDRANSFVYPARASRADAHLGMNMVFGKVKKKAEVKIIKEDEDEPEAEPEKVEEEPAPVVDPPKDTTQVTPDPQPVDTDTVTREAAPAQPEETLPPVIEEPKPDPVVAQENPVVVEEPRHETVKRGTHPEELPVSHYVIVGAFKSRQNAARYSRQLRDAGYGNEFGFVSDKNVYYVFVQRSDDVEEARSIRNNFRDKSDFQFAESWVLTVEE
jgi:cell division septation protein DedD